MATPVEPSAVVRGAAHEAREIFVGLVESGFTEAQALNVIGVMIGTAMAQNQSNQED